MAETSGNDPLRSISSSAESESRLSQILSSIDSRIAQGRNIVETGHDVSDLFLRTLALVDKLAEGQEHLTDLLRQWSDAGAVPSIDERRSARQMQLSQALASTTSLARGKGAGGQISPEDLNEVGSGWAVSLSPAFAITRILTLIDNYLLRRTLRQGFTRLDQHIQEGLGEISTTLEKGFERLDATFQWGFSELLWRLDQQTEVVRRIEELLLNQLDAQVRVFREKGIRSYNYGWFEEAKTLLDRALDLAVTDHVVAQYLGNIHLFYDRDYDQAILYYSRAARYSEPDSKHHYVVALMHQGLAYYLADHADKVADWSAAANCLALAVGIAPDNLEAHFQHAQYSTLCGDHEGALHSLDTAIRGDSRFLIRVMAEPDFFPIRKDIEVLVADYHQELSTLLEERLAPHRLAIEEIKRPTAVPLNSCLWMHYNPLYSPKWHRFLIEHSSRVDPVTSYFHYPYHEDPDILRYLEQFAAICELVASGDLISLRAALDAIHLLPVPRKKNRIVEVTFGPYYKGGPITGVNVKFDYMGIGGEEL